MLPSRGDRPPPQPLIGPTIRLTHLGSPLTPRLSDPRRMRSGASGQERGKGKIKNKIKNRRPFSGPLGTFSSGISRVSVSLDYSKQHLPQHRRSFVSSFPPPIAPNTQFLSILIYPPQKQLRIGHPDWASCNRTKGTYSDGSPGDR